MSVARKCARLRRAARHNFTRRGFYAGSEARARPRKIRWGIEHQKAIRRGAGRRRQKRRILGGRRHPRCCRQERQQGLWRRRRGMVDGAFVRALRHGLCQTSEVLGCPLASLALFVSNPGHCFLPPAGRKGTWCQLLNAVMPTSFLRHNFRRSITIKPHPTEDKCLVNPIQQRTGAGHAIVMINLILVL